VAAVHNPRQLGRRIYSGFIIGVALIGVSVSARHVWLQNLPADEVPECSPGLAYVFENFPLAETLKLMLNGTGECADIAWIFFRAYYPRMDLSCIFGVGFSGAFSIVDKNGR
jgi:Disulfide bond formation protein DsbB.